MLDTSVRVLRLLAILQSRPWWSGADLAERLDVTSRTVRNDIERLRILGYRVDSLTGPAGGYRLGAGDALPPLLLDEEEGVAVAVGLAAAASGSVAGVEESALRALAKLEQTLPASARARVDALRSSIEFSPDDGPVVDAATLTTVAAAAHNSETLRFDYRGRGGEASVRHTEPHTLVHSGSRWYLLAWDLDRDDWRIFRIDRIEPRMPTRKRVAPRESPEGGAAEYVRRNVAEHYEA
jgi:predicted DNA-binding transcriptional regulator YafY